MEVLSSNHHLINLHHHHRRTSTKPENNNNISKKSSSEFEKMFASESLLTARTTTNTHFTDNSTRFDNESLSTPTANIAASAATVLLTQRHSLGRLPDSANSDENSSAGGNGTRQKVKKSKRNSKQNTDTIDKSISTNAMIEKKSMPKLKESSPIISLAQPTTQQTSKIATLPKTIQTSVKPLEKSENHGRSNKLNSFSLIETNNAVTINVTKSNVAMNASEKNTISTKAKQKPKKPKKPKKSVLAQASSSNHTLLDEENYEDIDEMGRNKLEANESIRWEFEIEGNVEQETQRLEAYKMNRRKRYMEERMRLNFNLTDIKQDSNGSPSIQRISTSTLHRSESGHSALSGGGGRGGLYKKLGSARLLASRSSNKTTNNVSDVIELVEQLTIGNNNIGNSQEMIINISSKKKETEEKEHNHNQVDSAISSMSSNSNNSKY